MARLMDIASRIIDYESGELDEDGVLTLFSDLIKSGYVYHLQGSYGRMAASLIDAGLLTKDGEIQ